MTEQPPTPSSDEPAELAPDTPTEVASPGAVAGDAAEGASPPSLEEVTPEPSGHDEALETAPPVPEMALPVPAPPPPTPALPLAAPSSSAPPVYAPTEFGESAYDATTQPPAFGARFGALGDAFPTDRPEIAAGAAFAAGLVLALILRRLAR